MILSSVDNFEGMTKEHAQVIRALRISYCTWGRIAKIMQVVTATPQTTEHWGQVAGKIMCEKAATFFNDDANFSKEILEVYNMWTGISSVKRGPYSDEE